MLKVGNMLQLCSLVDRKWKVLIVDYDLTRLKMLEKMLHTCNFDGVYFIPNQVVVYNNLPSFF